MPKKDGKNSVITTITGHDPESPLTVTFERTVYSDFNAVEWIVWLEYQGQTDTPIVRNLFAGQITLSAPGGAILTRDSGDGLAAESYTDSDVALTSGESLSIKPCGGRPTSEAFPYFTVSAKDFGYKLVVGWSGQWLAHFRGGENNFYFDAKQHQTCFYLKPGEKFRTPIILALAYEGDAGHGINVWRHFYHAHIMPHFYESFPEPLLFCHQSDVPGDEWTQATGSGQIEMIKKFLARGMKFNGWWIDAGWYDCQGDWGMTGTWRPDPNRFPGGLRPIGDICAENNIRFLLWFEPERVRIPAKEPEWPNEWLLDWVRVNGRGEEEISEQYL